MFAFKVILALALQSFLSCAANEDHVSTAQAFNVESGICTSEESQQWIDETQLLQMQTMTSSEFQAAQRPNSGSPNNGGPSNGGPNNGGPSNVPPGAPGGDGGGGGPGRPGGQSVTPAPPPPATPAPPGPATPAPPPPATPAPPAPPATPAPPVAATNDPHVTSLSGEKFDVNQPGNYVLLRAPLEVSQPALFELRGLMEPDQVKPCGLYIKAANLSGTWFGGAIVQVRPLRRDRPGSNTAGNVTEWPFSMQVSPKGSWKSLADFAAENSSEALTDMVKVTAEQRQDFGMLLEGQAFTFHIGNTDRPAAIVISQASHQALNVNVENIQALGHRSLGGLLGTEKHSKGVEEITEACKVHKASELWRTAPNSPNASRLSASWF